MKIRWLAGVVAVLVGAAKMNASSAWERVEAGLSRAEVKGILGEPLMMSVGRGFEVWIYDAQREVVWMRGVVVAWTAQDPVLDARGRNLDLRGVGKVKVGPVQKKKTYVPRSEEGAAYAKTAMRRMRWRGF